MKQGNAPLVRLHPLLDWGTVMNSQIVHNEKALLFRVLDQALHKQDEDLAVKRFPVDHPAHLALVCNARNHVGGKSFGLLPKDRGLALGGVSPPMLAVVSYSGFISPVNLGILAFGLRGDGGVSRLHPLSRGLGILLVGWLGRFLWSESPAIEIFATGADWHGQTVFLFDELANHSPRPECKGSCPV